MSDTKTNLALMLSVASIISLLIIAGNLGSKNISEYQEECVQSHVEYNNSMLNGAQASVLLDRTYYATCHRLNNCSWDLYYSVKSDIEGQKFETLERGIPTEVCDKYALVRYVEEIK